MIQWIQYYWLLLVLKKYIRQHKLPVTIHSTFPMIQLHTNRNWFYFITITAPCKLSTTVNRIRRQHLHAKIILVAPNVNYSEIFEAHLELFGIVDTKQSLFMVMDELNEYLEYLFQPKIDKILEKIMGYLKAFLKTFHFLGYKKIEKH